MWLSSRGFKPRFFDSTLGEQRYFEFNGPGPRPTLVALHGLSSGAVPLGPIAWRLRDSYRRILIPDLLGHGMSATPEPCHTRTLYAAMQEWLDATLEEPCVLFGHSMGGGFALNYALNRPDQVRGLVLISPAGAPLDPEAFDHWVTQFHIETPEAAKRFVSKLYTRLPWYASIVVQECRRLFRRDAITSLINSFDVSDSARPEQLAQLQMPVRIIWGGLEATFLPEQLEFFKAHLPEHAEFIEPAHFTHCPYLEFPDEVTGYVKSFSVATRCQEVG